MTIFWRNFIIALFWVMILLLVRETNTSQMFLTMLFSVVVLHFSEDITSKYISNGKSKKPISLLLSGTILVSVSYALYVAFIFMAQDLGKLIETSQPVILNTMKDYGVQKNFQTISDLYTILIDFLKANVGFITFSASLLIKVVIGIILGVVVHFSTIEEQDITNAWGSTIHIINEHCKTVYKSFRDIMSIQILISLMNTTIIAVLSLGITYLIFGEFLPYWYVIIPLTAILSLIPVVGNILINIILILATIQLSPMYVLFGLGMFLVIHKLELIVIGNKMNEKVGIPFIIILFSMILGEMLFHSMSGMMLGMVIMIALSKILRGIDLIQLKKTAKMFNK